jgi:nicotinamidase-related amidase
MQISSWAKLGTLVLGMGALFVAFNAHRKPGLKEPTTLRALYGLKPKTAHEAAHTALVLVDFQNEFVAGRLPLPGGSAAIERAVQLAAWARSSGMLVVLVQNIATRAGSPIFVLGSPTTDFVPGLQPEPTDLVLQKSMFGAFSRTHLDTELRARGIDTLIVGGFMTHLAVLSTASDAALLDYHVLIAADATATRALPGAGGERGLDSQSLERALLAVLADRVADVLRSEDIMAMSVKR